MPRNASGTYTLPIAAFVAGGVIRASDHNSNYSDIASAITQSLATTGVSSMTGQIKAAAGSAATPSYAFSSDTTTGFYLSGSHQIAWVHNGTVGATFNTDGTVTFVGAITIAGAVPTSFPAGTAMLFAQTAAPTGWTKSVTHNDKALRVVSGTAGSGGTTAFTSVFAARTILEANLPVHTHTVTDPGHTHPYLTYTNQGASGYGGGFPSGILDTGQSLSTTSNTTGITIGNTGSGTAMDFAVQYVDVIIATKDA